MQIVTAAIKLKDASSLEESCDKLSILKSRDISLLTKVHLVKAVIFPVVTYGCESWTIKERLSAEELMVLNCGAEMTLESP